jgi:hypothetical protein
MATFKCLVSGNLVTFVNQVDIDSMKGHDGYVRIDVQEPVESQPVLNSVRTDTAFAPVIPTIKRMGRPRKVANV